MADTGYEFVALQPITVGGVLAYNVGDFVPAANVEEQGYVIGEQVAARDHVPAPVPVDPGAPVGDVTPPDEKPAK